MPKIVIAAGGTAGHVVPALAVADELRASGADVVFVGTRERAEAELVPAAGYEISLPVGERARPRATRCARAGRGRAGGRGRRRGARPAGARSAPTPCSAAAATSPARSASRRSRAARRWC